MRNLLLIITTTTIIVLSSGCHRCVNGFTSINIQKVDRGISNRISDSQYYTSTTGLLFIHDFKSSSSTSRKVASYTESIVTDTSTGSSTNDKSNEIDIDILSQKNRGDARGAALLLENVAIYRGPAKIVSNINWRVEPNTKWALVGTNGAGKSTILKAIVGQIQSSVEGTIIIGSKQTIGYLQQTAVSGSTKTIYDEAMSGMIKLNKIKEQIEYAANTNNLDLLQTSQEQFEALDGYKQDQKVSAILKGLGFTNFTKRCDELSGGWQMRVAFAKQLLSEPTLSLLDEPGNHLDAAAKKWLAKYLANYNGPGSIVLVTHDVELLSSMDHIAEVIPNAGGIQIYKSCNYEQFLSLKEQRALAAQSEYEKNLDKAAKLQSFVDRFGASANKASAAQSRVKQIEKLRASGALDTPPESVTIQKFKPSMVLPNPPKAIGDVLLRIKDGTVGYSTDKVLVNNVNIEITKGMKLLIRGPNGSGKSTCLHTLRGSIPLLNGQRSENELLCLGMFTQDLAQELDITQRAVDIVTQYARDGSDGDITISDENARNALGRLGLTGEKSLRQIADLSGGEKARVALAMFSLKPSNVYFLDEPSNHLDIECIEALSDAICEWDTTTKTGNGALVVVSHDENFCSKIQFTHVATVQDGIFTLEEREANANDWIISSLSEVELNSSSDDDDDEHIINGNTKTSVTKTTPLPIVQKKDIDPKLRKIAFNAPKQIKKIEKLINEYKVQINIIDDEMFTNGHDISKITLLSKSKQELLTKISKLETEWFDLEAIMEQVNG